MLVRCQNIVQTKLVVRVDFLLLSGGLLYEN